jgi:alanine racemase
VSSLPQRCWAEIDLAALERNLGKIRAALPPRVRYVAVVKADAYGHGLAQTVSRLMQCGADCFAVANVSEAAEVREIGSGWPVLVLGALLPGEESALAEYDLMATVSTLGEIERLNAAGRAADRRLPVHLKIDTGMGRLGVWHLEAAELARRLVAAPHLSWRGVFTHFSCADSDPVFTAIQRRLFLDTLRQLPAPPEPAGFLIHADNSAGLESFAADSPINAVRVGLLQFGLLPYPNSLLARLQPDPVLSFHARVSLVKDLPAGTGVSYGRTHTLARDSRVAVLTVGYGDGLPTAASNRAQILVRGRRCPVLGRVTMDQTIVDVSALPEIAVGDIATLIGEQDGATIGVAEFSHWCDCIPWETFCSITKRVPRIYKTARH